MILKDFAKKVILKLLSHIQYGQLSIYADKDKLVVGNTEKYDLKAVLHVHSDKLYSRIIKRGSIGAAESFMLHEWDSEDAVSLLRLFIRNHDVLLKMDNGISKLMQYFWRLCDYFKRNTREQSRLNISAHYDLGNDFFKLFLDPSLMYSCALFKNTNDTLEKASQNKIKLICEKLNIRSGTHILEIGTGWGGLAIYMAQHYDCHITTTTISEEQYQYTQKKIAALGLTEKITVLKKDYRNLSGTYDRIVSIEMIEAVGYKFMKNFISQCNQLLNPQGLLLIQAIIRPDQNYHKVYKEVDFIKKYIFPGGCLVSTEFLLRESSLYTDLRLFSLMDMGYDYAKTLSAWRDNFFRELTAIRQLNFNEEFIRMWEYYFIYCEAAFLERYISVVQLAFIKPHYEIS